MPSSSVFIDITPIFMPRSPSCWAVRAVVAQAVAGTGTDSGVPVP